MWWWRRPAVTQRRAATDDVANPPCVSPITSLVAGPVAPLAPEGSSCRPRDRAMNSVGLSPVGGSSAIVAATATGQADSGRANRGSDKSGPDGRAAEDGIDTACSACSRA